MTQFDRNYRMTINGASAEAEKTFEAFNPATREVIAQVPDASREQLDAAVAAARTAFVKWSKSTQSERQKALEAIADALEKHAEDFIALLTKSRASRAQAPNGR